MSRRPAKKNRITFTLYSTGSTTKVLVVHLLYFRQPRGGKNNDSGVSDDSGDVKETRFMGCRPLVLYQSNW